MPKRGRANMGLELCLCRLQDTCWIPGRCRCQPTHGQRHRDEGRGTPSEPRAIQPWRICSWWRFSWPWRYGRPGTSWKLPASRPRWLYARPRWCCSGILKVDILSANSPLTLLRSFLDEPVPLDGLTTDGFSYVLYSTLFSALV
jgi:hypothetical protein